MTAKVFHAHLWGKREEKYAALEEKDVSTVEWTEIEPESPFHLFIPQNKGMWQEYQKGWSLPDVFPVNSVGIVTARDHFVIDFDKAALEARMRDFLDHRWSDAEVRERYGLKEKSNWQLAEVRRTNPKVAASSITPCLYRPFDVRYLAYLPALIERGRWEVMGNMLEPNLMISATRGVEIGGFEHVLVSDGLITHHTVSMKEVNYAFTLYSHPSSSEGQGDLLAAKEKQPNLAPAFVEALSQRLGLLFDESCHRGLHTKNSSESPRLCGEKSSWNPEDLFCYAYAVFHSPTYRERYAEFLKIDFPRLPLTSDAKQFFRLADLGEELVRLHLMRSPKLDEFITGFPHSGNNEVEKISYKDGNVRFNKDQYFSGAEEEDWNFHIGGYQVLAKWLKDRKGRKLSFDDIGHYQKIVVAIHETRRLMAEIDATIPSWPIG